MYLDENHPYLQSLLLLAMHVEAPVQPDWHKGETEASSPHLPHISHSCQSTDLRSECVHQEGKVMQPCYF